MSQSVPTFVLVTYTMQANLLNGSGPNGWQLILWDVQNTPDYTGQFSGYQGQLQNITINAVTQVSSPTSQLVIPTGPAGGDLSGNYPNPLVNSLQGVVISGVPGDGYILQSVSATSAVWIPASTGAFVAGGDLTGTDISQRVASIQGVVISGAASAGNALIANSSSAASWQPVTTIDGVTISGGPTTGQVLTATGVSTATWSTPVSGGFTAGGDLSGTSTSQLVRGLDGNPLLPGERLLNGFLIQNNIIGTGAGFGYYTLTGDVSSSVSPGLVTVNGLQGNAVQAATYGSGQNGYVLTWNNTAGQLQLLSPTNAFTAGGDLTGTATNQTVNSIQGVVITGTPASGYILEATSPTAAKWQVDSNAVTFAGDLSGSNTSQLVRGIDGNPLTNSPGANRFLVQNLANTGFGYYTLTGDVSSTVGPGVMTVIALQGNAVEAQTLTSTQDGYVLTWKNASSEWIAEPPTGGSGSFSAGGDLTGTSFSQQVVSLTGATGVIPIASSGNVLTWAAATTAPGLTQASTSTASATGATMKIAAQQTTGTTSIGGSLILAAGIGTSTNGTVSLSSGATAILTITGAGVVQIPAFTIAGLAHNDASGNLTSSLLVNADVSSSAAIAYSKLNLTGNVVNADISSGAAIAYSKLNLTGDVVNADISTSAAIAYSKLNLTGDVVNGDIASAAAIAVTKLAAGTTTQVLLMNSTTPTWTTFSGDVVVGATGATTVNKIQGVVISGTPSNGYILEATSSTAASWQVASGTFTAGGDLGGSSTVQTVKSITGSGGVVAIAATGNVLTWATATTAPGITQSPASSGTGALLAIQAQSTASGTGGALSLASGTGTTAAGAVSINAGNTTALSVTGAGVVQIPAFTSAGLVHNDTSGNLTSSLLVNADISTSAAIVYSKLALGGNVVNTDISSTAAVAVSKLAAGTAAQVLITNASGPTPTWTTLSGDVVVGATGTTAINSVTVSGFKTNYTASQGTAATQVSVANQYVGFLTCAAAAPIATILTIPLATIDTGMSCTVRVVWRDTSGGVLGSSGCANFLVVFNNVAGTVTPASTTLTAYASSAFAGYTAVTVTAASSGTNCLIRITNLISGDAIQVTAVADCILN